MAGEVLQLLELDVGLGFLAGRDLGGLGAIELIAGGTRLQRVFAGLEPIGGKRKFSLSVGHDADCDRRAFLLGADYHAFHRGFFGRADLTGQSRGLGLHRRPSCSQKTSNSSYSGEQTSFRWHRVSLLANIVSAATRRADSFLIVARA